MSEEPRASATATAPGPPATDPPDDDQPAARTPEGITSPTLASLVVPAHAGTLTTALPGYHPAEYAPTITGSGAEKLATSAVAPLVAHARGYTTVTPDRLTAAAADLHLGSLRDGGGKTLAQCAKAGMAAGAARSDTLVMPWFKLDNVLAAKKAGTPVERTTLQFRPSTPVPHPTKKGEVAKYKTLAGQSTVLDVHPATPPEWLADPTVTVVMVEGLLKGDAVLTATLRHAGTPDALLRAGNPDTALADLETLLRALHGDDRFLVVSFVGAGNWKKNPEWVALNLAGRDVLVAMDADVTTNYQVHRHAAAMFTMLEARKATPRLIDMNAGGLNGAGTKMGVDDYLASYGTWGDLLARTVDELPTPPRTSTMGRPGEWRVEPTRGLCVEECVGDEDALVGTFTTRVGIGARIVAFEFLRVPDKREEETGVIANDPATTCRGADNVRLELTWDDPLEPGRVVTATVQGPAAILNYPPDRWDQKGARIPTSVLSHPEWPPTAGEKWLRAVKMHRREEITEETVWQCMGWVPSAGNLPVFLVGEQVVGADHLGEGSRAGVTSRELSGASDFGVIDPGPTGWRESAAADLPAVVAAFLDSGAWTNRAYAVTNLALGLRPALPRRPQAVTYMAGPPRRGKSWAASMVMSFWQARAKTWTNQHLPGQAKDTVASTEHAVARTPIWVADDLAPSPDRNQASREESSVGDFIRAVFNGTGKRRMNADGTAREVNNPRALLIITAENELSVSSARDRTVVQAYGAGSLGTREATAVLEHMRDVTGQTARLTGAFIHYLRHRALTHPGGWGGLLADIHLAYTTWETQAADLLEPLMPGGATRHAQMAADLMLPLGFLGEMAEDLGLDTALVARLRGTGLLSMIIDLVRVSYDAQKTTTPGASVLEALATALRAGKVHVVSAETPAGAPVAGEHSGLVNAQLGWRAEPGGGVRPQGACIGYLVNRDGVDVVLLDPRAAFSEAQRAHPELVQYGARAASAWRSLWDEGLAYPGLSRRTGGAATPLSTVRLRLGATRLSGVPVLLSTLLSGEGDTDDDS